MRRKLRVLAKEELLCHLSKSSVRVGGSFENEVPLIQDAFLFYMLTSEHFESHFVRLLKKKTASYDFVLM